MEPVTIAGLALGIAPLIISAVENYETTFQPFVTYGRYSREIDRFKTRLSTQKAIFNNECQLLLSAVENKDTQIGLFISNQTQCRLSQTDRDDVSKKLLDNLIAASIKAYTQKLHLIKNTLGAISRETNGFEKVVVDLASKESSFSHFRSRLKISFSKSRLNATVDELRSYNWDLETLRTQLVGMTTQLAQQPDQVNEIIADLNIARQASEKLHGLLVTKWACSDQAHHMVNLSLDVGGAQQCKFASRVKFHLSVRCIANNKTAISDTIWVDVESATKTCAGEAPTSENRGVEVSQPASTQENSSKSRRFGVSSKSPKNPSLDTATEELTRALQSIRVGTPIAFDPGSVQTSSPLNHSTTSSRQETRVGVSLSTILSFCQYFRNPLQQTSTGAANKTLTETTNPFQYHLYTSDRPKGCIDKTRSYKSILEDLAVSRRKIPWHEKFRLAQLLTLSVLRFRSTPWLQSGLSSQYLYFHESNIREGYDDLASQGPCLQAQLFGKAPLNEQKVASQQKTALLRNELLFHLGVLLLELGHDAPLQLLCQKEDIIKGGDASDAWLSEFLAAKRLGLSAAAQLNARYGKLARRCLDCDFGVGEDLDSPQLQQAVLVGIVEELDKCIEAEKKINLVLGC